MANTIIESQKNKNRCFSIEVHAHTFLEGEVRKKDVTRPTNKQD